MAWREILNQIGSPFVSVNHTDSELNLPEFPLIILTGKEPKIKNQILDYIREGGTLLTEADTAADLLDIKIQKRYLKYISSDSDKIFENIFCDIYSYCTIASKANHLEDQSGKKVILSEKIGKGKIIILPSGFAHLIFDNRIIRKNFYSIYAQKETNERVAGISKGMIIRIIEASLENLFHHNNLPFVSLWSFPNGEQNLFSFRIDTDFGKEEEVKNLYEIIRKNNISATWFVETKSAEKLIGFYKTLEGQEIGLHCYEHKVYQDYQQNYKNLLKGKSILENSGIEIKGFAAPFGEWNSNLAGAVEELGFKYSSEFSYAYDAKPFYPLVNNSLSKVLQVPIHPMSIGRLVWGGLTNENILKYFLEIIEEKLHLFEPVIFYFHPGEKKLDIIDKIFQKINSLNIPNFTFNDYSRWWKKRFSIIYSINFNEDRVITGNTDSSYWIKTSYPGKEFFISPLINRQTLKYKKIEKPRDEIIHTDFLKKNRKTTARMIWHDLLYKYRKLKK